MLWNCRELLSTGRYGGFQYTRSFLERLLAQVEEPDREGEIISHFPLFPPPGSVPGPISYYIDATLTQLFNEYGFMTRLSPRITRDALERESVCYQCAERVVCMSRWAARSVVEGYGVSPHKVHVIPGGANLDDSILPTTGFGSAQISFTPLRLGFIGKDFKRKNLAYVLQVAELIAAHGVQIEVAAAGFDPSDAPRHPLLSTVGLLDKANRMRKFIDFLSACHFGCLFSRAEAYGISNVEFIRIGVPVLTWNVGGLVDTVPEGLGLVFPATATPERVAETLIDYHSNPDRYLALRSQVAARAEEASWTRAIEQFQAVWAGSCDYSYASMVDD